LREVTHLRALGRLRLDLGEAVAREERRDERAVDVGKVHGMKAGVESHQAVLAISMKASSDAGFASVSRLAAFSGAAPRRIFLTGISSFFPLMVRGMAGTARISSGTCRGESSRRIVDVSRASRSPSSGEPSRVTTKSQRRSSR